MELCKDGMFQCAFELVFGVGLAVIALIVISTLLGISWGKSDEKRVACNERRCSSCLSRR